MRSRSSRHLKALSLLLASLAFLRTPAVGQTAAISSGECPYWIDVKTGDPLPPSQTVPIGLDREELYRLQRGIDPNQAHGASGRNYFRQPDGTWADSANGQQLSGAKTVPIGLDREEFYRIQRGIHPNQAHGASGRNYALVPCRPSNQSAGTQTTPALPVLPWGIGIGFGMGRGGGGCGFGKTCDDAGRPK